MQTIKVSKRGCGYPKEGGFYAIGSGAPKTCFALPVELGECPCCSQKPTFSRAPQKVTGQYMNIMFKHCTDTEQCKHCIWEKATYWLSFIGPDYTTDSFCREVKTQGLSRRIPPNFYKSIQEGDLFACVKGNKIVTIVPITSVRYYVKEGDDQKKLKELERDGVEVVKFEIDGEPDQTNISEEESFE